MDGPVFSFFREAEQVAQVENLTPNQRSNSSMIVMCELRLFCLITFIRIKDRALREAIL